MWPYFKLGQYTFYTFGLAIGLGIVCSCLALQSWFRSRDLAVNMPLFACLVIPFGFACARLDSVMFAEVHAHSSAEFVHRLMYGGLTYFGGFAGAILAFMVLMIPYRLPWLRTLDGLFCVSLAYGIGRVGCFLAGDGDYGIPSRVPWAMSFPRGVLPTLARVHPTMLYCTVWELALFAILWKVSSAQSTTPLRPGTLLSLYLIATSMGRFLIEFLSRNRTVAFGLTEAQLMSIALFLAGTTILILVSIEKAGVGGSIPSLATITASPRNAPEDGHSCPVDGADI